MTIRVRRAVPSQAELLTRIAHEAKRHWRYPEQWIEAWHQSLTITGDTIARGAVYIAEDGDDVIGFYALGEQGTLIALEHFWIRPTRMRAGVGRLLFEHAVSTALLLGGSVLEIDADPHAEGFYLRQGARRVGDTPADVEGHRRTLPHLRFDLTRPLDRSAQREDLRAEL